MASNKKTPCILPYKAQNIRSMFSRLVRDLVQKAKWSEIFGRKRIQAVPTISNNLWESVILYCQPPPKVLDNILFWKFPNRVGVWILVSALLKFTLSIPATYFSETVQFCQFSPNFLFVHCLPVSYLFFLLPSIHVHPVRNISPPFAMTNSFGIFTIAKNSKEF